MISETFLLEHSDEAPYNILPWVNKLFLIIKWGGSASPARLVSF